MLFVLNSLFFLFPVHLFLVRLFFLVTILLLIFSYLYLMRADTHLFKRGRLLGTPRLSSLSSSYIFFLSFFPLFTHDIILISTDHFLLWLSLIVLHSLLYIYARPSPTPWSACSVCVHFSSNKHHHFSANNNQIRSEAEASYMATIAKRQKLFNDVQNKNNYKIGDLVGLKIDRVDRTNVTPKILPCKIISIKSTSDNVNTYELCTTTCIIFS